MDNTKTLADVEPRYFEMLVSLNEDAYKRITAPDFVRVLPPPKDQTPDNLIYAWGLEMLRAGFELAVDLLNGSTETIDYPHIKRTDAP